MAIDSLIANSEDVFRLIDSGETESLSEFGHDRIVEGKISLFGVQRHISILENVAVEAIMLLLILPWIQDNSERLLRKWPARRMLECFWGVLGT